MERKLDLNLAYVIATAGLYAGHRLVASHPVKIVEEPSAPGEFTEAQGQQLLDAGKVVPKSAMRPTPVETPEASVRRLAVLEPMGDDRFLLRAPWLDEAETITGEEPARTRLVEVYDLGLEAYRKAEEIAPLAGPATIAGDDGFAMDETGSNGYYTVTAPGKDPEKVRGKANAETRLAELRAEAAEAARNLTVDPPGSASSGGAGPKIEGAGVGGTGGPTVDEVVEE